MHIESISLQFLRIGGWLAALLVLISFFAALWHYRTTVPSLSGWRQKLLTMLRATALALLVLAFAMPLIRLIMTEAKTPKTAILLDTSLSMALDSDPSRSQEALHSVKTLGDRLGDNAVLYRFGSETAPLKSDNPAFDDEATDIAAALAEVSAGDKIAACVIVSDGRWNMGLAPLAADIDGDITVHTVAAGSYDLPGDISLLPVSAPSTVYSGEEAEVTVTLESTKVMNGPMPVSLNRDGETVASAVAVFDNSRRCAVSLRIPVSGNGLQTFEAAIDPENDLLSDNNSVFFDITALQSRFRVLVLAAAPSPDLAFLRRVIEADDAFESVFHVSGIREEDGDSAGNDSAYDLYIVLDGGGNSLDAGFAEKIVTAVDHGAGLLFIGSAFKGAGAAVLASVLPLRIDSESAEGGSYHVSLTGQGSTHFITSAGGPGSWQKLPPLHSLMRTTARSGSQLLAEAEPEGKNVTAAPLIATGKHGSGAVVAIPASGIWRWKLMMTGTGMNTFYDTFITAALRWIVSHDAASPLTVTTAKTVFLSGEDVDFEARLYDSVYMPVSAATVTVTVDSLSSRKVILDEASPALYSGAMKSPGAGGHTFHASAYSGDRLLAESRGTFTVTPSSLEFRDSRPDHAALAALAKKHGGLALSPSGVDSLYNALDFAVVEERSEDSKAPWLNPLYPLLIIILLSLEWALRKRFGLL